MIGRVLGLLLLTFTPFTQGAEAPDKLIGLLNGIDMLTARYEQESQGNVQKGQFWLSRPDQFRLSASAPISQTIISDGDSLWTHDLDLEQVIVTGLRETASDIPLLLFAGQPEKLRDTYDVEWFADEALQHFVLTPVDQTGAIGSIAVSFAGALPQRLVFQTAMQQRTVVNFYEVSAAPIDAEMFTFQLPEGVDVIDDRAGTR